MPVMQTVRRLNDLVVGKRKSKREQAKQSFLIGLGGCIVALALLAIFRQPLILSGAGGFIGMTLGGGVRWWNAPTDVNERRSMSLLTGVALLVMGGFIAAFVTMSRWDAHDQSPAQPQLDPYRNIGTMIVLCERTTKGDPYTYQADPTDVPKCKNGAVPKVVVRG